MEGRSPVRDGPLGIRIHGKREVVQQLAHAGGVALRPVLSRAGVSDNLAKTSENVMRICVPPLQHSKKGRPKVAALPQSLGTFLLEVCVLEFDSS